MRHNNTQEKSELRPLVLVVDDEESICSTVLNVLRDEDFAAISASDGEEALAKVREFRPRLVFLDIWMPGWDGIETLEKIKAFAPETEVVMMSGHATIANALEALKRGASDFLEKPFNIDSVINSAARAMARSIESENSGSENIGAKSLASTANSLRQDSVPGSFSQFYQHPGISSPGLRGRNLGQRTLKESAILYGQCLHSGVKSGLVLEPLAKDSGLHFSHMGSTKPVPIHISNVESTELATTVRQGSTQASTIEHLMAALHAYKISNLLIKCNGEIPIFDGSSEQICQAIESAGIEEQGGEWFEIAIDREYSFVAGNNGEQITIEPADEFSISYQLDYPQPVGRQVYTFTLDSPESFRREISPARTFGFVKDAERLQKVGLAAGARLHNFILIGTDGVINTELRFADELVRHKILDSIGDLFLIGRPIRGAVKARMTGHSDNVSLLREVQKSVG